MTTVYEKTTLGYRLSWGSVLAGSAIALVTYLTLSVLGTAIGASAVNPMQQGNPLSGFGTGAGIWIFVSSAIALAAGAFVAGRTAPERGGLHGVLSWTLTTLLTTYLLASLASGVAGVAGNVVGKGLSIAGDGVAAAAPGIGTQLKQKLNEQGISLDWDNLQGQLDTLLKQTGKTELDPAQLDQKADQASGDGKQTATDVASNPLQAGDALKQWFERVRKAGEPALNAADKQALVNIVAARTGKSQAEASQIVENYAQAYAQAVQKVNELKQQAEQKAREAAQVAAVQLSHAAWATLAMLLVGAALSFFIGRIALSSRAPRVIVAS
ncbi:MAG: hypothetical protein PW845_15185 [Pseudomonas sp.]|nr:hypothetical protein [Pseudomonas sp.]